MTTAGTTTPERGSRPDCTCATGDPARCKRPDHRAYYDPDHNEIVRIRPSAKDPGEDGPG